MFVEEDAATAAATGAGTKRVHAKSWTRFIQPGTNVSSCKPGAPRKIPSFETSGIPRRMWPRSSGRRGAPSGRARGRPSRSRREAVRIPLRARRRCEPPRPQLKLRFQPEHPRATPATAYSPIPEVGNTTVWNEMNAGRRVMTEAYRSASSEPGTRSALKTSVSTTIGPARTDRAHDSTAAKKAAPSSSLRSSITI